MKRVIIGSITVMFGVISIGDCAIAQVVSDNTVGTTVNLNGTAFEINNGTRSGNNLFHSFSQFSVPTNASAIFNNATDIQNIFSRVTGSQISNIDGILKTQGNANLFLMNPSGIVFGPNAQLQLGGSFLGTTANSIKFADGIEFNTVNETPALLSVKVPIGLQMGQNSGAIAVQGPGHTLFQPSFFYPILQPTAATGLSVRSGNTLALIGHSIDLPGGVLLAPSGHLELGSLPIGTVGLNTTAPRWTFDYGMVSQFSDIRLSNQALVDGSGAPAGSLHLQGHNISFREASVTRLQNFGNAALGNLNIDATGILDLQTIGNHGFQNNLISTENLGTGRGSDLQISARQLLIKDGGVITTKTFTLGNGGNMSFKVQDSITLDGWASIDPTIATAIGAATLGSGNGGELTISSRQFIMTNGASILNLTAGTGRGGDITVQAAERIELDGENPIISRTTDLANTVLGPGNGGNLTLTSRQIVLRNGAGIGSSTLAAGHGGNLNVTASDRIEILGMTVSSGRSSRIVAKAELLPAVLRQAYGLPDSPTGDSGHFTLNTPRLEMADGALVGVDNQGTGNAGALEINADQIHLDRESVLSAASRSGKGGNITLMVKELLSLRHGSQITTSVSETGAGAGGNMTINAPAIVGFENSDIHADAIEGKGGNIQITTQGIFGLKYRNYLTPENDITASSKLGINGNVQVNTIGINPTNSLNELPIFPFSHWEHLTFAMSINTYHFIQL